MSALLLGGIALYALTRSRARVSHAALTSLGVVTDTKHLTLTPIVTGIAVEIVGVDVIEDPVPGTYAKVWVHLKANATPPLLGLFCRIIDDDLGMQVGQKKNWYDKSVGSTWTAKYDAGDDWGVLMPNRVWNLRIEVGTN